MNRKTILIAVLILALFASSFAIGRALASPDAPLVAPGWMNYQGYLTTAGGLPFNGTANFVFGIYSVSIGGSPLWSETHNTVPVSQGNFSVMLGSITPLTASAFSTNPRYLQVSVDTGSGSVDLPRQQIGSTPFALQAEVAASAPWSGLTGVPAGFADGVDNSGAAYDNVIIVAKTGGDFSTIQSALNSIGDASITNRYLVWVGPGDYNEKVSLKPYVDVVGAGRNLTKIISDGGASESAASTVSLTAFGTVELRHLSIQNNGQATYAVGIYTTNSGTDLTLKDVSVTASQPQSFAYGISNNGTWLTVIDSSISATSAGNQLVYGVYTVGNAKITNSSIKAVTSNSGNAYGFNTPTLDHELRGVIFTIGGGGASGTGYGIYNNGGGEYIYDSKINVTNGATQYGIYNIQDGFPNKVEVHGSQIVAATNTVLNASQFTTQIATSQLSGGAVGNPAGTLTCAGVYDESFSFFSSGCP